MNDELIILKELNQVVGFLTPEGALHTYVNLQLARPMTISELRVHLADLEAKFQVVGLRGENGLKWKITDNGKARLMENQ